jgi:hypothetical protein
MYVPQGSDQPQRSFGSPTSARAVGAAAGAKKAELGRQGVYNRVAIRTKIAQANRCLRLAAARERDPVAVSSPRSHELQTAAAVRWSRFRQDAWHITESLTLLADGRASAEDGCSWLESLQDGLCLVVIGPDEKEQTTLVDDLVCDGALAETLRKVAVNVDFAFDVRRLALRALSNSCMAASQHVALTQVAHYLVDAFALFTLRAAAAPEGGDMAEISPVPDSVLGVVAECCPAYFLDNTHAERTLCALGRVARREAAVIFCVQVSDPSLGERSGLALSYLFGALCEHTNEHDTRTLSSVVVDDNHTVRWSSTIPGWMPEVLRALNVHADDARGKYRVENAMMAFDQQAIVAACWWILSSGDDYAANLCLLLIGRFPDLVEAIATDARYSFLELCSSFVHTYVLRVAALRALCVIPCIVGSRTAVDGPLFSKVRDILESRDPQARIAAMTLLLRLRDEGFGNLTMAFCNSVSDALANIALAPAHEDGAGDWERSIGDEELGLAEQLLELINLDPFTD